MVKLCGQSTKGSIISMLCSSAMAWRMEPTLSGEMLSLKNPLTLGNA